ncbi:MAG: SDR family oxidoreductase [Novosphingobium sp.]|nr:SDR family oxidoreductase [Novosphingobium sp.]MCP5379046.1 SDR family oxidoreductase [Novosphingobium sp.]MCP5388840.1 SDR family oxidoreductase [Novosphingobium sp.]
MTTTQHLGLAGRSVFITGGGAGIGAALTEAFLGAGARVAFVQRSDASEFAEEMSRKFGQRPLALLCDVTDIPALQGAMAQAAEAHGAITVLVNNAADDTRHDLGSMDADAWDNAIAVNLRPHFFTAQAATAGMRAAGGGAIINLSSISYMMGNAGYPAYVAAKAGITGLTRALARELGPDGIRVNALLPGWVLTERQRRLWATPDDLAAHLDRQCLKRHLTVDDVTGAALFLASDAAAMMTGQALVVDGGVVVTG